MIIFSFTAALPYRALPVEFLLVWIITYGTWSIVTTTSLRGEHVEHGVLIEICYIEGGMLCNSRRVHLITLKQWFIICDV